MNRQLFSTLLTAFLLTGCCNYLKPLPPRISALPAPISMEQQIAELNARAVLIPRFKAKADQSGIEAILPDENGKPKRLPASEGTLMLEQKYATHSANLTLTVRYLLQDIFELGRNDREWWAIERGDHPKAYSGSLQSVANDDIDSPATLFQLLTEAIPELLAITEIAPDSGQTLVMRVDDERGVNDLLILRGRADGAAAIEREIIVDRRSGEVREVDLFSPNGLLLVRATLNNYEPVTFKGTPTAVVPTMPRSIVLDYPARQSRLGLRLASVQIYDSFPDDQFSSPDWKDVGITPDVVK